MQVGCCVSRSRVGAEEVGRCRWVAVWLAGWVHAGCEWGVCCLRQLRESCMYSSFCLTCIGHISIMDHLGLPSLLLQ